MGYFARLISVLALFLGVLAAPVHAQQQSTSDGSELSDDGSATAPADDVPSPGTTIEPQSTASATPTPMGVASPTPAALSVDAMIAASRPSVVRIVTDATLGSGVKIADGVLTSAHVVKDTAQIDIYSADHRHAPATVARIDPGADVALLKTDLDLPALDLEPVAGQNMGDAVVALGYPGDQKDPGPASVAQGQLSSTGTGVQGRSLLQTTAALQPGYSGGPLLNSRGHVIGLNTFVDQVEGQLQLNFFLGSDTAYAFLALPTAQVAPRPIALFSHDPRNASLPASYLGTGWVLESEDTSHVAQGDYASRYHLDFPDGTEAIAVQTGVAVMTSPAAAAVGMPQAVPSDQQFDYIGSLDIGDEASAWLSKSHKSLVVTARVDNVILMAGESLGIPLDSSDVGDVADMVHTMANRVVSQVQ